VISLDEARRHVLGACAPLSPRRVALADALGLVLAEDVASPEAVPPFAGSAMDGFAVRAADTADATEAAPAVLTVVATLAAGEGPSVAVAEGEAIRIMTGAPMPPGADAVVMVERTVTADDGATVEILTAVEPGTAVRAAGDDLTAGQAVFAAGDVLGAGHLGVLASIGRVDVLAVPRPVVGVFSTGDELVEGGGPLGPGQIRDSNRLTLLALLQDSGCDTVDLGRVGDDPDAIAAVLLGGVEACDAVVTSGGVSMGDFDYVKVVLDRLGDMRWMQVAIKPAKPLAFGTVDGVPVFGLPGNPVSSMVSFELFARPGLRRMAGWGDGALARPTVVAVADEPLRRRPDGKIHFARVTCAYDRAQGVFRVRSAGGQGSHQLTAMARADALAVLPDGDTVEAGAPVDVLLLGPWGVD
jgi:molybdopterin molybdotransferase